MWMPNSGLPRRMLLLSTLPLLATTFCACTGTSRPPRDAHLGAQEERLALVPGASLDPIDRDTLMVHFDSDVLFDRGSAALSPRAQRTLDELAAVLEDDPDLAVVVEGHTDSTGSGLVNQALSVRRADAVRGYLILRGVSPERMTAIGLGETDPRATNDSEPGRRRNRRVDIRLKAKAT